MGIHGIREQKVSPQKRETADDGSLGKKKADLVKHHDRQKLSLGWM
jgi:hypothetical protein